MSLASDLRAMRDSLEDLEDLASRPREWRKLFQPSEASVRLALEIALAGGRAELPRKPSRAWIDLLAGGWLHSTYVPGSVVVMDDVLLAAFASRTMAA